jgi:hypothetical protein
MAEADLPRRFLFHGCQGAFLVIKAGEERQTGHEIMVRCEFNEFLDADPHMFEGGGARGLIAVVWGVVERVLRRWARRYLDTFVDFTLGVDRFVALRQVGQRSS